MSEDFAKTELWFRNPHNYIKEMVEVPNARRVVWDRGMLVKKRIDPQQHGNLFFGRNPDWKAMCIGEQGAAEINFERGLDNPVAVYPVWDYAQDTLTDLEEWIKNPIGENRQACAVNNRPRDEVPVYGQRHMIVLVNMPNASLSSSKFLARNIREIKEEYAYTGITLHVHGSYAFSLMFGMGMGSADMEPRTEAAQGKIIIPPGKKFNVDRIGQISHWVGLLDFQPGDLRVPRNRCIFNIKSGLWASEHWLVDLKFRTVGRVNLDPREDVVTNERGTRVILGPKKEEQEGDKIVCNSCSLQDQCKYFREDSVCTVPGSEISPLATFFKSRNAEDVIAGISTVLAAQAQRLERGVELEEDYGELDPEVTKIANQVFNNGAKLAKLLDPSLTRPAVSINVGPQGAVASQNPKQVIAQAVRAIQQQTGLETKDITQEMIIQMMVQMGNQQQAIEQ